MKRAEASQVAYRTHLLPVNDKIQEDKDESDKELFFFFFFFLAEHREKYKGARAC